MKWQRFVSSIRIRKVLKGIILLSMLKLCVLGAYAWQGGLVESMLGGPALVAATAPKAAMAQSAAQSSKDAPAPDSTDADPASAPASVKDKTPDKAELPSSRDLDRLALHKKEADLNRRETELKALETDLKRKLVRLQEMEARIKRMLEQAEIVKDKKLKHLVSVYSNMKARQAAQVLETLDEKIAVKILAGMAGRQAGEILTYVNARKAARLSEALTKLQTGF